MALIKYLEQKSEGWWLKKKLKPWYMPLIKKVKYRAQNKVFLKEGDNVLNAASQVLQNIGVFHWLEFGTLLGVIRDGKLIAHDTDIDFGVFLDDRSDAIADAFQKAGFKRVHRLEIEGGAYGLEESYELNGVNVDLFYFTKTAEGMYCHLFPVVGKGQRIVRELFTTANEFKSITWQNVAVNIPADTEKRLTDTYGDYTVPIKDWHTPTQALNSATIDKDYKEIKS